jgi:hypothetical protein
MRAADACDRMVYTSHAPPGCERIVVSGLSELAIAMMLATAGQPSNTSCAECGKNINLIAAGGEFPEWLCRLLLRLMSRRVVVLIAEETGSGSVGIHESGNQDGEEKDAEDGFDNCE